MKPDLRITDPDDFEKVVARQCMTLGYEVVMPTKNNPGYDIELVKGKERIAVQVKCHKAKQNTGQYKKFVAFLELPIASNFTSGWFISQSGYSKNVLALAEADREPNLKLGTSSQRGIKWNYDPDLAPGESPEEEKEEDIDEKNVKDEAVKYFGIFTCKGGVGKTTVAAHLAGAFAIMGYDVILLDLDPDRNLRKLFLQDQDSDEDASLYIPPNKKGFSGATITVLNADEWDERSYSEKVVICDCSPVLSENPKYLIRKFDYCVIPTTLNPLGIAKNGDVITRTFKHIRKMNNKAEMFCLINSYSGAQSYEERNKHLLALVEKPIKEYQKNDPKCQLIHPDYVKIRESRALRYWGYHLVDGSPPQLAFKSVANRSAPRTDFMQLAEYLEDHTSITSTRELD